jgi:serine protease Do
LFIIIKTISLKGHEYYMQLNNGGNAIKILTITAAIIIIVAVSTASSLRPNQDFAPVAAQNVSFAKEVSSGLTKVKHSALDFIESGEILTVPEIVQKIKPSVVGICTTFTDEKRGTGTGIIISEDGLIATNCHVVEENSDECMQKASDIIVVLPDKTEHKARVLGTDPQTDLAVIDIDVSGLPAAKFGDSSKVLEGSDAIAVGNPLGLELYGTVTKGIISALERTITVGDSEMTLFQTDAAINPGNSGGPLCNLSGEVIGINSSKIISIYAEGIGFAIPSNAAEPVIADLIEFGYVRGRPAFGFSGENIDEYSGIAYGVPAGILVRFIAPNSSAAKSELKVGDIIVKADDKTICDIHDLSDIKKELRVGDDINLTVYRPDGNCLKNVKITLRERGESAEYR